MEYLLDESSRQKFLQLLADRPALELVEAPQALLHRLGVGSDVKGVLGDLPRDDAACSSSQMVDAGGNTVTHGFILVLAVGPYVQQRGVREHCTVLHWGACSRGYKRGERGRETPRSLLEEE